MKKRIDNHLAAMMERNNKLEIYLNAFWFVPLWLVLKLYSTLKNGAVKS